MIAAVALLAPVAALIALFQDAPWKHSTGCEVHPCTCRPSMEEALTLAAEALHYFGAHQQSSPRHRAWVVLDEAMGSEGATVVRPSDSRAESQAGLNGPSGSPTPPRALVIVALTTHQSDVERRLRAACELGGPQAEAQVSAKFVDELVAADLDALAALIGWDAVSRLRVGDVASGGLQSPVGVTGTGNGPDSPGAPCPNKTLVRYCECEDCRGR